jgi:hypothetical protein
MTTWIRAWAFLAPFFMAVGLLSATTYTINVSANTSGVISYVHSHGGKKGHQFVKLHDTIVWQCDPMPDTGYSCSAVGVKFKSSAPCTVSMNTCYVTDNSDLAPFPYSIAVSYNSGLAVDDPDVIVDNAGVLDLDGKQGAAPKKAVPKKK